LHTGRGFGHIFGDFVFESGINVMIFNEIPSWSNNLMNEHYKPSNMGEQEQKKVLYPIVWLLLLIFVAWPISFALVPFWVLFLPFELLFDFGGSIECAFVCLKFFSLTLLFVFLTVREGNLFLFK